MRGRVLIANADDLGFSNAVDDGILVAANQGIVRSASLLVTSPRAPAALQAAHVAGLSVGLHLNASQSEIVACRLQPFTRMVSHCMRAGIRLGAQGLEMLLSFFDQQLDMFGQLAGCPPAHINVHHPLYRIPDFGSPFAKWVEATCIPSRRTPELVDAKVMAPAQTIWGFYDKNNLSTSALMELIDATDGTSIELVSHPGNYDPDLPSKYRMERVLQREILCDVRLREAIDERDFEISDFERWNAG